MDLEQPKPGGESSTIPVLAYTTAATALADIVHVVEELKQSSQEAEPDAGRIHRNLLVLRLRFEDFTVAAQALITNLEAGAGLAAPEIKSLVCRAERFLSEFVMAADHVQQSLGDIEAAGFHRLLQAVAQRGVRDGMDETPETIAAVCGSWHSHWNHVCGWFLSQPGHPSNAETLRERIRSSIPALLRVVTSINDRQIYRIDRSNDFRVLARWFAEAESDDEAHRVWRALFGFCSARHFIINDATLDDYEARHVSANMSWLDAPPLRVPMRLREHASNTPTMISRLVDRSAEKEKLAAATREEAARILNAQVRFGTGRRMRLSELEYLEADEFDLFLNLLAEAVSARVSALDAVEILSSDGNLKIKLEPTGDQREALILTTEGTFSGPDHWITVEPISSEEVLA